MHCFDLTFRNCRDGWHSSIEMNRELSHTIASLSNAERKIEEKKEMAKSLCQHMDVGTIQREN